MRVMNQQDRGVSTPVEMMYLLVFCVVSVVFLGFLGRLHAAGVEVTNTAQAAARAASLAPSPGVAEQAAMDTVSRSSLAHRCTPRTTVSWTPSGTGAWQGGAVTVEVACTVQNQTLTGVWSPGSRTVVMRDTQPVDRYQR
jgi:Flp pilus assembly protein TadG